MTTPNNIQSSIEQRVMAGVGVIYTARKAFSATMLKLYVFVLAMLGLWRLVWVTRIEQNFLQVMRGGAVAEGNYAVYAFVHTHLAVQITFAIAAVALVLFVADLVRSVSTPRQHLAY
jgi:hypothetical protein